MVDNNGYKFNQGRSTKIISGYKSLSFPFETFLIMRGPAGTVDILLDLIGKYMPQIRCVVLNLTFAYFYPGIDHSDI